MDAVELAQKLLRCPSVTPADAGAIGVLESALRQLGFACTRLTFGAAPDGPIDNLFATIGSGAPHFAFAGHTDVVPAGEGWTQPPFAGAIVQGQLVGRGAADMKSALAAMVAAAATQLPHGRPGTLSFIITGDEEGPATHGTQELLRWMEAHGHIPDMCLVGEPTSASQLGDMMKIGRRGSLNAWITVHGQQGHVAYPQRADNPVRRLLPLLSALQARVLDDGTDWFQPSNLEITDLGIGNPATNVIPAHASARLNIRFNDCHSGESLARWLRELVARHAPAEVDVRISGEAFLTAPGQLSEIVAGAVQAETGLVPEASTSGGTSDARFIRRLCPVVEFGLPGATMHKADEQVATADIHTLARIYAGVLARVFA